MLGRLDQTARRRSTFGTARSRPVVQRYVRRSAICRQFRQFEHPPSAIKSRSWLAASGELKIIAAILEQAVIEKIVAHLRLDPQSPPKGRVRELELHFAA